MSSYHYHLVPLLWYLYFNPTQALHNIRALNRAIEVIPFANEEIEAACRLMDEDGDYRDLEDTVQYVLAKKMGCDLILSNDGKFVSKEIEVIDSQQFCTRFGL